MMQFEQQNQPQSQHGQFRNGLGLPRSITCRSQSGQLVEVVALGDAEGYSPACWLINEQGQFDIASTSRLTVIDPEFLPNRKSIEVLTGSSSQSPSQSRY